ncbi:bis-aminopropyl spermidine synthase family protein [Nocardiopsis sp. RSe5-2]|uniref:Bis-aminopropyl spermidine synthase family protein n=1 Tax=Nocardiopsis endophytica TaxID=3018445 RepID=A0ABT4UDQ8_9ACTN|nr:bis-aminopropyl spermidine synthase family protein [Nocardiopsis endophytica]MDA2815129.1 bis-aminopropyl spermidine synthase family protein [Nocardiopsis endophytica]
MNDLPPELSALLDAQGADAARAHRVLAALSDGAWWSPRELVRATAVAHRTASAVLDALGPDLERDSSGAEERVRLVRTGPYAAFDRPRAADPWAPLIQARPEAAEELRRLVAEAPPSRTDLDHVAATARTALRRGVFLDERFDLAGRRLLCVGDHDLTSLAALLVRPEAEAVVVDVDERMLAYIGAAADRLGLRVRCHFADLRLGLPPAVAGACDVVFTDPPYTPEGVELFVRRGLEGMADPRRGRVVVAYGASETTPGLVAKTQARLARMDLVFEAVHPDFNRYSGAEAIGAASDLYVLRPLARAAAGRGPEAARIYSQGGNAKEAAAARSGELEELAGSSALPEPGSDGGPETVVGDWPATAARAGVHRVRLGTWMSTPVEAEDAVVNLTGGWEALLGRALLASGGMKVRAVVPASAPQVRDEAGQRALAALLGPGVGVRFRRGGPGSRLMVVEAAPSPPGPDAPPSDRLRARCRERAHGPLPRVMREALIAVAAEEGRSVNKKTARRSVAEAAPWAAGHTLLDLPEHRFPDLDRAAERIFEAVEGDPRDPGE